MANRKLPFDPGSGLRKIMDNMESFLKELLKLAPPYATTCETLKEKINEAKKALRDAKRACEPFSEILIEDPAGQKDSIKFIEQDPPQAVERLMSLLSERGVEKDREAKIKNNIACAYVRYAPPQTETARRYLHLAKECTSKEDLVVRIKNNIQSLSLIDEQWAIIAVLSQRYVEKGCKD